MPAQTKDVDGLRITVRDKRWWRRWIPFYTDYFTTSFWVDIERFEEASPEDREISAGTSLALIARFPDGKFAHGIFEVPESDLSKIKVREHVRKETDEILVAPAGQVQIVYGPTDNYTILFSYFVRSESAVMAGIFALLISLIVLGGSLGGAVLGAWLQPDPPPFPTAIILIDETGEAMMTPTVARIDEDAPETPEPSPGES